MKYQFTMPSSGVLCLVIFLFSWTALGGRADFESDYGSMKEAAGLWNFSTKDFDKYLDPFHGPEKFHLNAKRSPWAGNYFAMEKGGLAQRWQDIENPLISDTELQNLSWAKNLTEGQIRKLSPAEKYDLYMGNYDLPMTRTELQARGPKRAMPVKEWEGFCNGVRCAGINLKEPKHPVNVTNPDGIKITFDPADLKALAGATYFYVERYAQLGSPSRGTEIAFKPPNPAIFDLALRFFLAKKRKAFVVDSSLDSEVWNESVTGFKRNLGQVEGLSAVEKASYPWATKKIEIRGTLDGMGEIDIQESNKTTTTKVAQKKFSEDIKFHYTLFLDSSGRARDGVWQHSGENNRGVDFIWFGKGKGTDREARSHLFTERETLDFEKVRELFNFSQRRSCRAVLFAP